MTRAALALILLLPATLKADETLFSERVAPGLRKRCVECHNPQKSRGGLDLTTRARLLRGGDQGEAIVPGKAEKSLLIEQITGAKPSMPRKGAPLSAAELADLRRWIDAGAPWPKGVDLADSAGKPVVDANWWSLRKLQRPALPAVKDGAWVRTPVDRFILAKLDEKRLKP